MKNELIKGKSEYESLREHITALRDEIALLTAERDELLLRECPRIRAEYNVKVGSALLELYTAKARLLQLRRAIEILQAARNRQEHKDADEAQEEAREAYRDHEKQIEEEARKVREAKEFRKREEKKDQEWRKRFGGGVGDGAETGAGTDAGTGAGTGSGKNPADGNLPAEPGKDAIHGDGRGSDDDRTEASGSGSGDSEAGGSDAGDSGKKKDETPKFKTREEALKYFHRKLVKLLHPDANPGQSKEDAELFLEMEKAFQEGDLDRLIEIYDLIQARDAELHLSNTPEDIERLREIAATLERKKNSLLAEIEEIKSSFPYTAKALLENEEELAKILHHIKEGLAQIEQEYQKLLRRFERLKQGKDPGGDD